MAGSVDRKVLHEFLERKGFNFAEDIDLAQLDRQHRKIPELAETPAQQPRRKKRKPDILRILEGDDTLDDGDTESQASIPVGSSIRRRNSEAARQAKTAWAQETAIWEQDFRLARNDVDKAQSTVFKETFIRQTKSIYTEIDRKMRQRQQEMDYAAVFQPAWNAVRAESKKRVMLAKNLNYDDIRRISSKLMLRNATSGTEDEDQLGAERRNSIWAPEEEQNEPQIAKDKPAKTLRQRQRDALSVHMHRRSTEMTATEDFVPLSERRNVNRKLLDQGEVGPLSDSILIVSQEASQQKATRSSAVLLPIKSIIASNKAVKELGSGKRKDVAKLPGSITSRTRTLKSIQSDINATEEHSKEVLHATPVELLEVEDIFAAKRRDIRSRSADLNEGLNAEALHDIAESASSSEHNVAKHARGLIQSMDDSPEPDASKKSKSPLEHIGFFKDESASSLMQEFSSMQSPPTTAKGIVPQEMTGHIQIQPDLSSQSFMAIVFSEMGSKKPPLSIPVRPAPQKQIAPHQSPRRTRYLQPMTALEVDKDPPRVEIPQGLQPFPGTRALNPFYTTFSGPSDILLQAAKSRLTPRIATAHYEEAMQAPTPRTLLEPIYRPDHDLLRVGTPDLEERLKKEMAGLSLHLPMPTLGGDVDLMKLVGPAKVSESSLFGPAPNAAKRSKLLRRHKNTEAETDVSPSGEDQTTADLAKTMMIEESAQFVRGISEADQKIMKEERAASRPPAPLNQDMALRLEAIWEALEMPLKEKLGILVKYSAVQSVQFLSESLDAWEEAAKCVGIREEALNKLVHSIKLDKAGNADHSELRDKVTEATTVCAAAAEKLLMEFGDVLTFRGMPYVEELDGNIYDSIMRVSGGQVDRKNLEASLLPVSL